MCGQINFKNFIPWRVRVRYISRSQLCINPWLGRIEYFCVITIKHINSIVKIVFVKTIAILLHDIRRLLFRPVRPMRTIHVFHSCNRCYGHALAKMAIIYGIMHF